MNEFSFVFWSGGGSTYTKGRNPKNVSGVLKILKYRYFIKSQSPPSLSILRLDKIWQDSRAVTSALAFISSCANPILYAFAGRSYIKADGLAFMARLFEGTVLDYGARRSQAKEVTRL